jgi:vacuolar-type H+-ATPase subunit I/STV1
MENKINAPINNGEEPKDVADVVSEVIVQKTNKKNSFLVNARIKSSSTSEDNAERELQAELMAEKQTSSDLRELVKTQQQQIDDMMKKIEEGEAARARKDEENEKRQAETDAMIRRLMSMIPTTR